MNNSVMHPDDECRPVGAQPPLLAVGQEVWVRGKIMVLYKNHDKIMANVRIKDIDGDNVMGWFDISSLRHPTTTNCSQCEKRNKQLMMQKYMG